MKKIIIAVLVVITLLSGVAFAFTSNNFAMFHIFGIKPVAQVIYEAVEKSINSEYHNLSVKVSAYSELDDTNLEVEAKIKIKAVGTSFEFIGSVKSYDGITYNGYYSDGIYYESSANGNTKQVCSFDTAINYFLKSDADYIFPVFWQGIYDFDDEDDIKVNLTVAAFPFYIGQRYEAIKEDHNAVVSYELDVAGNLRRRKIIITETSLVYTIDIRHAAPKPFTLNFPDNLDTYITIV